MREPKSDSRVLAGIARAGGTANLVAQICNLPYRGFAVRKALEASPGAAGYEPAIQQITNLRYLFRNAASKLSSLLLLAALVAGTPLSARGETLLLTGATVHTVSGETLAPGQVLIRDGKIAAVGTNVSADRAASLDLAGHHLYPGLIALDTVLGLTEISGVRSTQDTTEVGDDFTPDVESWIAVNPDSELIPVTRANGITCFEPTPKGHIISGQSAMVAAAGWTSEQMIIKKPVALHLFWPAMDLNTTPKEKARDKAKWKSLEDQATERRARLRAIEDFFEDAKAYARAKDAAAKGQAAAPEQIPAWDAMLPYVRGELPVTVHADEIRQIRAAIHWADTNHYRIILADGRDAWMAADLLATKHVPVIYAHIFSQPTRDAASYDIQFRVPDILHRRGVPVAFGVGADSFNASQIRNLPHAAAQAVAFGLPEAEALKGLTLYPAQMAGVADRLGSIEPGKDATLFAADGDILDIRGRVKRMWIAGKEVSLESRHTRLYEKYKNRPRPE
jgi:imidazolonepropionase-like amidohydrolase